jgi:site-specific DNA-methyltransferase (adenine-specific)
MRGQYIKGDCMEYLSGYADNHFDLAIVDPPYGIEKKISAGGGSHTKNRSKFHQRYKESGKSWDRERPKKSYWNKLFRVSKNQIVFGANYFVNFLPVSRGWAFWHKQGEKMSSVNDELIFTSFDISIKTFSRFHGKDKGFMADHKHFHPTTKPVALYRWLLQNYAKENDLILDTHVGSASSLIACEIEGFDYVGFEKDADYYAESTKRIKQHLAQKVLF